MKLRLPKRKPVKTFGSLRQNFYLFFLSLFFGVAVGNYGSQIVRKDAYGIVLNDGSLRYGLLGTCFSMMMCLFFFSAVNIYLLVSKEISPITTE